MFQSDFLVWSMAGTTCLLGLRLLWCERATSLVAGYHGGDAADTMGRLGGARPRIGDVKTDILTVDVLTTPPVTRSPLLSTPDTHRTRRSCPKMKEPQSPRDTRRRQQ